MPQIKVKVFNPVGKNGFTCLKSARRDVKRGRGHWLEVDMVIEYSASSQISPPCRPFSPLPAKPTQSVTLPPVVPAVEVSDSQMAQTFLPYPQRSLESCRPAYPALSRPGGGFGASGLASEEPEPACRVRAAAC